MSKKTCAFPADDEVAPQPTNTLHKLARDFDWASLQLEVFEVDHAAVLGRHATLKALVVESRNQLEIEAKQQARTQGVDFKSDYFHIRVQKRNVRVVSPGLLNSNSTAFFPGTTKLMPVAYACPDLAKINLKKFDEYVASGLIPAGIAKGYTDENEPQFAFIIEPRDPE